MAVCEVTGKHTRIGNNVSHANNKTKRTFKANIQTVRIIDETGTVRRAAVSTTALKGHKVQKAAPRQVLLRQLAAEGKPVGAKKAAAPAKAAKAKKSSKK